MRYREFIPDPIREEVESWGLSLPLLRALWEAAHVELSTRDDRDFRRSQAPVPCLILPLCVEDPETGDEREFLFYIDTVVRPGERTVIYMWDTEAPFMRAPTEEERDALGPPPEITDD